jgi:uncharacterized membrane protein
MKIFIGHLHPLVVHLPIGIWIIYLLIEFLKTKNQYKQIDSIIKIVFYTGTVSAVASIITGLINANQQGYPTNDVFNHQWMAIGTSVLFLIFFYIRNHFTLRTVLVNSFLILLFILISITGHLGGILTHGEDYFSIQNDEKKVIKPLAIQHINEALIYKDLVQYIFDKNCVSCHGQNKQKGNLRLDTYDHIMSGGKSGKVIQLSNLEKSELIKRILLDQSDEKHMPPKDNMQLETFEIQMLKWWVSNGAETSSKVKDVSADTLMIRSIKQFHDAFSQINDVASIKRPMLDEIDATTLKKIQSLGWSLIPLSKDDHYYRAVAFNVEDSIGNALKTLSEISKNIIELKLSFSNLNDKDAIQLSAFRSLEKLWLDHTLITSKGLENLKQINNLNYLNLFACSINERDLSNYSDRRDLKLVYPNMKDTAWKIADTTELTTIKKQLP